MDAKPIKDAIKKKSASGFVLSPILERLKHKANTKSGAIGLIMIPDENPRVIALPNVQFNIMCGWCFGEFVPKSWNAHILNKNGKCRPAVPSPGDAFFLKVPDEKKQVTVFCPSMNDGDSRIFCETIQWRQNRPVLPAPRDFPMVGMVRELTPEEKELHDSIKKTKLPPKKDIKDLNKMTVEELERYLKKRKENTKMTDKKGGNKKKVVESSSEDSEDSDYSEEEEEEDDDDGDEAGRRRRRGRRQEGGAP